MTGSSWSDRDTERQLDQYNVPITDNRTGLDAQPRRPGQ